MAVETQIAAKAADGTLASLTKSLASVGTASKAFVLMHPISLSIAGGTLLGFGICYTLSKRRRKNAKARQRAAVVNSAPMELA